MSKTLIRLAQQSESSLAARIAMQERGIPSCFPATLIIRLLFEITSVLFVGKLTSPERFLPRASDVRPRGVKATLELGPFGISSSEKGSSDFPTAGSFLHVVLILINRCWSSPQPSGSLHEPAFERRWRQLASSIVTDAKLVKQGTSGSDASARRCRRGDSHFR